jgi:hypothetical protein
MSAESEIDPIKGEGEGEGEGEFKECCICKNSIGINNVAKTACDHEFHVDCLVKWLIKNKTCPMCRAEIKHESNPDEPIDEEIKEILVCINDITTNFRNRAVGEAYYKKFKQLDSMGRLKSINEKPLQAMQICLEKLNLITDWYHFRLTLQLFEKYYPDYFKYPTIYDLLKQKISVDDMEQLKAWPGFYGQLKKPGVQEKCDAALADRPILKQKFNQIDCIIM